jgi:ATP-dependent Lon protease
MNLITSYTKEAGVRDLQRKIVTLIRASSEKIISSKPNPVIIESKNLTELIGPEKFRLELAENWGHPGVSIGLAWTPVGGDILFIETTQMPGKGELILTGQLGDVMKESAQISLSLARTLLAHTGFALNKSQTDLHIHIPAGAIQKDGPSAGVTMLTSIASKLSGIPVKPKLAMTGEVTLRGAVMPVGGIKEKVIAAHRSGVSEVILPAKNEPDLRDVPADIKAQLKIYFVDRVEQVLDIALGIKLSADSLLMNDTGSTGQQSNLSSTV